MNWSWRSALSFALAFLALMCLVFLLVNWVIIPPLVVFLLVFSVLAVVVGSVQGSWPVWVSLVAAVAFTGGNMRFITADIVHPETALIFVPTWFTVLGTLFAIVAAVMVLRR